MLAETNEDFKQGFTFMLAATWTKYHVRIKYMEIPKSIRFGSIIDIDNKILRNLDKAPQSMNSSSN